MNMKWRGIKLIKVNEVKQTGNEMKRNGNEQTGMKLNKTERSETSRNDMEQNGMNLNDTGI